MIDFAQQQAGVVQVTVTGGQFGQQGCGPLTILLQVVLQPRDMLLTVSVFGISG